jgi:hypothetical protein
MPNQNGKVDLPREVLDPLRHIYRAVGNEQAVEEDPLFALETLLKGIEEKLPRANRAVLTGLLHQVCDTAPYQYRREHRRNAA